MVLRETEQLPPRCALEEEYGAALKLDAQRVAVNFVSTLDGVVSFGMGAADSRAVSGGLVADRLVMAMLRASAGVIVIGAGTLRATLRHQWTPEGLLPGRDAALSELRAVSGLPGAPAPLLVVSGTGLLPHTADAVARPATPAWLLTKEGVRSVADAAIGASGPGGRVEGRRIVAEARTLAPAWPILCEGGPTLLGSLLEDGVALDLFLTLAPQLAGMTGGSAARRRLIGEASFAPFARRGTLRSVRAAGAHLLLRYAIDPA